MASEANINTAAAALIAAGYRAPAVYEQIGNWILTELGKDAAGNDNTHKYVDMSPEFDIPTYGAALVALDIVDPVSIEQVGNIVLTYTP